jgi:hypothetical protein
MLLYTHTHTHTHTHTSCHTHTHPHTHTHLMALLHGRDDASHERQPLLYQHARITAHQHAGTAAHFLYIIIFNLFFFYLYQCAGTAAQLISNVAQER